MKYLNEKGHEYAMQFCKILEMEKISYLYHLRHPKMNSCMDSEKIYERIAYLLKEPIITCRHLVLKERKGDQIFLLVFDCEKGQVDLQKLRSLLQTRKMEFLDEVSLEELLHTYPGNVSIFHSIFDQKRKIRLILDSSLMDKKCLAFHPLYNGDTIFLEFHEIAKYLEKIHHEYQILDIPIKQEQVLKRVI